MKSNFIQSCLEGDAFLSEIDDFIDSWHEGDSNLSLHEFLGMTRDEYEIWLKNPDMLPFIIRARKDGKRYVDTFKEEYYQLAARAENAGKARELKKWLEEQGLWTQ